MPSDHLKIFKHKINRRNFLVFGALVAGKCLLPSTARGAVCAAPVAEKSLSLCNLHTSETLETVYWRNGEYVLGALEHVNYIFRDRRTEEIHSIDTELLDLLYTLKQKLKTNAPFSLVCGYRSPETNSMLRKRSRAVAKKSFHLRGQAVDIRVPGFKTASLRQVAMAIRGGGVGYYPRSRFVHVDVGPVRFW